MKLFLVFAAVILAASASSTEELWKKFKQDHEKTYKSLREEKLRFEIFKSTLDTINEHNAKYANGEESWFMGVNQFSDLTEEEFKALYLSTMPEKSASLEMVSFNLTAPDSIDWRQKGAVLSVKNQGSCGSCWAFSAAAAIEGQNALKHEIKEDLSEQELVDCAGGKYENEGCNGGLMDYAFKYVRDHGLSKSSDYPYRGTDGSCRNPKNSANIKLTGFRDVRENSEDQLKQAVATVGPVSVAIDAERIQHYAGGIFNNFFCGYTLNHGVLAVGYGTENHHDFWIVKNSWGTSWGDNGYIKMTRNRFNQCGIASQASYPVLA